jgi:integrase
VAPRSTGQLIIRRSKRGVVYAARLHAYGRRHYVTLGRAAEGWDRRRAEQELANIVADARRGVWRPAEPRREPEEPRAMPSLYEFASEWFEGRRLEGGRRGAGLTPAGEAALRWQLELHILPAFGALGLDEITVEELDRFRRAKVAEGRLNATSINKCLATLAAILEVAVEYGHIPRNPARGKRRRLPALKPRLTYLDSALAISALFEGAGALDRERRSAPLRRPLLATLTLAGLRIGEALALRWSDVDLARGVLRVRGTKTDAAERTVDLLPLLRDELSAWAALQPDRDPGAFVFATATGRRQGATNIRRRVLAPAVARANQQLRLAAATPLPEGLTPHSLRRTFASILVALGEDPAYVMAQMGHSDPKLTLSVYAREMRRKDGERERLRALVAGAEPPAVGDSMRHEEALEAGVRAD